jgi:ParB-like chromosome segregation protein Spo0J
MEKQVIMEDSLALDIPIIKLRPLRDRQVTKREYDRILASIKAIGMIEPLIVYAEGDDYAILDGVQRYRALLEIGVEVVPCIWESGEKRSPVIEWSIAYRRYKKTG